MDRKPATIRYRFHLPSKTAVDIPLEFDAESFLLKIPEVAREEDWVGLESNKCSHCPLTAASSPTCPFARGLSRFIHQFDDLYSYENVVVEVITPQRTTVAHGAVQKGLSSLAGLVGATCGCPHLAFFRPMARFHLPFATEEETLFRGFSVHLLGEFIAAGGGGSVPVGIGTLQQHYEAASLVNRGMAERLRAAFTKDAVVNGLIILDTFAQAAPYVMKEKLEELRYIFPVKSAP